ncbi:pilus assembly protein CpaE [Shewanella canadensis]|uniref:Pilus assembly protein CpaE n=1 Tax=Shewanella canadensis TaxID=271096 RepID=A0A3S0L131_9GAMM|nr:AAA family ATPase [Shewanella canadensis]RTR38870.1 pilus assembly protein CpaE [Shewanella canadensis]
MDKPLELLVTNNDDSGTVNVGHSTSASIVEAKGRQHGKSSNILSYPVHALLINSLQLQLTEIETKLNDCLNLSWEGTRVLNAYTMRVNAARPYNLILLVLPNEENSAMEALTQAASYGVDIVILGQNTPQSVLRLAFQQGVSDFIPLDEPEVDLLQALEKIALKLSEKADLAPVVAVMNGKGGSGASFIATSMAVIASAREEGEVALLDTDLLQGTLAHMLGLEPSYFITEAIQELESLDEVALKGTMTNKGHLHLLAAKPFAVLNATEHIELRNTNELLLKCRQYYDQVIVDLSRGPEVWNADILTNADILLVMQQNVMSIRETKAIVNQLVNFMGIDSKRIHLLVNRYQKTNAGISLKDIQETTGIKSLFVVANDFKLASQCIDLGTPITDVAKREQMLTDLNLVTEHFFPKSSNGDKNSKGFWNRLLGK